MPHHSGILVDMNAIDLKNICCSFLTHEPFTGFSMALTVLGILTGEVYLRRTRLQEKEMFQDFCALLYVLAILVHNRPPMDGEVKHDA
ncbi:MAG: hypothetical protein HND56_12240 [Pseudomonadota bacterium]|nr:MAG: hypothetical protein HND56_12240 [Pseudomonadota bacterium]